MITLRQLEPGCMFRLYRNYRDGRRRPYMHIPERRVVLYAADVGCRGSHKLPVTAEVVPLQWHLFPAMVEITKPAESLLDVTLQVEEHCDGYTLVCTPRGTMVPMCSDMRIWIRKEQR